MGIEINTTAPLPKRGMLRKPISRDTLFGNIDSAVKEYLGDSILHKTLVVQPYQHRLYVDTHPAGESMVFTWTPRGIVQVSVKTSTVGPGFHIFAVDLIRHVGEQCGLQWDWSAGDETGFAQSGDAGRVEREMLAWLQGLAKHLVDTNTDPTASLRINMPLDCPYPQGLHFSLTPGGPLDLEWWQGIATSTDLDDLRSKAVAFFPWWEEGYTAGFYHNLGRVLLWCDVPWRPPTSADEEKASTLAIECLERSQATDATQNLPERELAELKAILQGTGEGPPPIPARDGLGFRRHPCRFSLPGSWSITVPGYFFQEYEDDRSQCVFWYGDRTVRVTTFELTSKDGSSRSPADIMAQFKAQVPEGASPLAHESINVMAQGHLGRTREEEHDYWMISGQVASTNAFAVVTICFDRTQDREWALATFKSIDHVPEE